MNFGQGNRCKICQEELEAQLAKSKGCCPEGDTGPTGYVGESDAEHISKPSPFAALPPCSPANARPEQARLGVVETGERVDGR